MCYSIIMIIAMTQRKGKRPSDSDIFYTTEYCQKVFDMVDVLVLPVSNANLAEFAVTHCDALVIPGGADVVPSYYGEKQDHPKTYYIDNTNDELDFALIKAFRDAHKPILGICRGIQVLNVYFGGTLYQHIDNHSFDHNEEMHLVQFEKDSFLYDCYGVKNLMVNSYHHQCIKEPAPGFKVIARSPDGIIEGIQYDNVYAVQWHPEMLLHTKFFAYFKKVITG